MNDNSAEINELADRFVGQGSPPPDLGLFENLLRRGRATEARQTVDPSRFHWMHLVRAPQLEEASVETEFAAAFAGLAELGLSVAVWIDGAGAYWAVGKEDNEAAEWFRHTLAPNHEFAPNQPSIAGKESMSSASRLLAMPPTREVRNPGQPPAAEFPSVVERALIGCGPDDRVFIHLTPWSTAAIEEELGRVADLLLVLANQLNQQRQISETRSVSLESPTAKHLFEHLTAHRSLLEMASVEGGWSARVYTGGTTGQHAAALAAKISPALPPRQSYDWLVRRLPVSLTSGEDPRSLGPLPSRDAAAMLRPPRFGASSVLVAPDLPRGRSSGRSGSSGQMKIANLSGTERPAPFEVEDLVGHGFICGTTGAGKTSSVLHLLRELNNRSIPFLIVDPVKADYEAYADHFQPGLEVIDGRSLIMNVMEPWPGFDPEAHIGLVLNAFRGSFDMPTPIPYVATRLLESSKHWLSRGFKPNLHDVRGELEALVRTLGYAPEIESNIQAALGTRLDLLTDPLRADRVAGPGNQQLERALQRPTVIQLSSITDEEERAFLMTMLATFVAESARVRGGVGGIHHVTVIEEAHRIMPEVSESDTEAGATSSKQLSDLLAEIRSYGESILVLDQSPSAVARQVIRNTNLKVLHRIVDPVDREIAGQAVGLKDSQADCLLTLRPGQAITGSRHSPEPRSVQFTAPLPPRPGTAPGRRVQQRTRRCCEGGPAHHVAERLADEVEVRMHLELVSRLTDPKSNHSPTSQIQNLAAAHRVEPACLWSIGLRRLVRVYAPYHQRDCSDMLSVLERRPERGLGLLAQKVSASLASAAGPYEGCARCPARCMSRTFVERGFGGRVRRLALLVRHGQSQEQLVEGAAAWIRTVRPELTASIGEQAAWALSYCSIVHRMGDLSTGSDVTWLGQTQSP